MLKKKYHVRIEDNLKHEFFHALKMMGVEKSKMNSTGERDNDGKLTMYLDFFVELTKYELLFLRLVCSSGEFKKVIA